MTAKAKRAQKRAQNKLPTPVGEPVTDSDVLRQLKSVWPLGLTRREIATSLGRQVTPTLIARIEKWVDAGYLTRDIQSWPNGVRGYKYTYVMSQGEMATRTEKAIDMIFDSSNTTS